ncbi:MAG: DUF2804 domain-containing protein [bacterium]
MAQYTEKELSEPVALCRRNGSLNPAAVGWSRRPLQTCNLRGRWPRKKKWNYWCVLDGRFAFSATIADVDYLGLAAVYFLDFEKRELLELTLPLPFGAGLSMGERVEEDVVFETKKLGISLKQLEGAIRIQAKAPSMQEKKLAADILIDVPDGHETLNVAVPWNPKTFQFTSKQNCLPARGSVRIGDEIYEYDPETAFGVLDFGRGIWPYRTKWNWGSFSQRRKDCIVGVNLGGKWTDGTGANENSITLDGKLYKVMEDLVWVYDTKDFMKPWKIKTEHSDAIDLELTPFYDKQASVNLVFLGTKTHQCFGRFSGTLKAGGKKIEVENAVGWAEESISKW